MSLRSVLFKCEDVLSQFFCIESKGITFKDLKPHMKLAKDKVSFKIRLAAFQASGGAEH